MCSERLGSRDSLNSFVAICEKVFNMDICKDLQAADTVYILRSMMLWTNTRQQHLLGSNVGMSSDIPTSSTLLIQQPFSIYLTIDTGF